MMMLKEDTKKKLINIYESVLTIETARERMKKKETKSYALRAYTHSSISKLRLRPSNRIDLNDSDEVNLT